MSQPSRLFRIAQPLLRPPTWGDAVVFVGLAFLIYLGVLSGAGRPAGHQGSGNQPGAPSLALLCRPLLGRMAAAYILSVIFSLVSATFAANHRTAEKILIPLLDALQTMPNLVIFAGGPLELHCHLCPSGWAVELSSIILIFTSQAWNIELRLVPISDHHSPEPDAGQHHVPL